MHRHSFYRMIFAVATSTLGASFALSKDLPSEFLPHSVVAEPVLLDTQETIVVSNGGQKYRQIEFNGDKYLVGYSDRDQTHDDEPVCVREIAEETPKNPETFTSLGETTQAHHRESFMQGLKLRCQKMPVVSPFEVGLRIKPDDTNVEQASAGPARAEKSEGLSARDRMKREINAQDGKPAFGSPGNKGAGIPF